MEQRINPADTTELTVYFDGSCPVCRREIAHYRRRSGAAEIAWVDVHSASFDSVTDLDRSTALARLHVRLGDGELVDGSAAFRAIWQQLPAWRWLARVTASRPATLILDSAYAGFLAWRGRRQAASSTAVRAARKI